ncbi:MAG: sulfatase-like hydrolase/transferase [Cyclobacteriaceae bacterium]
MKKLIYILMAALSFHAKGQFDQKPNIVLIMADDLGFGDISCYGSTKINTPVLDKMASEGMKFIDYHSNGSVCTPTRAALLTGNYQQRSGLEGVIYVQKEKRVYGLANNQETIAEYLKKAGYATGIFGKWHLGYQSKYNPTKQGFDEFNGYVSGNIDYISHRDGINIYDWWHNTDSIQEEGYVTDLITNHALEFIEENKSNPLFLYLPHEAPHFPYQGRNDPADRLPNKEFNGHGSRPDKDVAYKEMVEIMDENIGRVLDKLEVLGLLENTFVFFCSDNGATKLGNNGNLRGHKGSLWEGGHRVPAIAWWPGKIPADAVSSETILSMDILPTILSLCNVSTEDSFDGKDFSQALLSQGQMNKRPVFWRYRKQKSVRFDHWKFIQQGDEEFLFDLKKDLYEKQNLNDSYPEKTDELKALLTDWESEMKGYQQKTN